MADTREKVAQAIEQFIASPQVSQSYRGDLFVGFEMRRDMPIQLRDGYWFSAKAVETILEALSAGDRSDG